MTSTDLNTKAILISTCFRYGRRADEASAVGIDRGVFFKFFALTFFDIIITLPVTVLGLIVESLSQNGIPFFWPGWSFVHAHSSAVLEVTSDEWKSTGRWSVFSIRYNQWINPIFALVFFCIFGLTKQSRERYRDIFKVFLKYLGFSLLVHADPQTSDIEFGSAPNPMQRSVSSARIQSSSFVP